MAAHEHPILFSGEMVRAILAGRKTQTRRVVTAHPSAHANTSGKHAPIRPWTNGVGAWNFVLADTGHGTGDPFACPYGAPGDRLWVRETFAVEAEWTAETKRDPGPYALGQGRLYAADYHARELRDLAHRWTPSIFMRRRESRITLCVESVRVERLQEISPTDACAEGIFTHEAAYRTEPPMPYPVATYKALWDSLNAKRGFPWSSNPWVWAVTFRHVKGA